jgi:hypothetical protein
MSNGKTVKDPTVSNGKTVKDPTVLIPTPIMIRVTGQICTYKEIKIPLFQAAVKLIFQQCWGPHMK